MGLDALGGERVVGRLKVIGSTPLHDRGRSLAEIGKICGRTLYVELEGDPERKEREYALIVEILKRAVGWR